MKNFLSLLRKSYVFILEGAIILFSGFMICNWDYFEERISPNEYWALKVHEIEKTLQRDQWLIRDLELTLEKENRFLDIDVQKAIDRARSFSQDIGSSKEMVVQKHDKRVSEIQTEIDQKKSAVEKTEKKLAQAKLHLEQAS